MTTAPSDRGFAENFAALAGLQKSTRGVSLYSVRINRPAGRVLAALAASAGATPNRITLLGLGCSLIAIALIVIAPVTHLTAIGLTLALAVGYALDSADGQLARLQGSGGPAGEWLDHMIDAGIKLTLHLAIAVSWFTTGRRGPELLLPLAFQVIAVLMFLAVTLGGTLRSEEAGARVRPPVRRPALRSVLLLPVDHGVLCLLFLAWAWPSAFRIGYAGLLLAQVAFLIAFAVTVYPELARTRPDPGAAQHSLLRPERSSS